ncbi:uncharacterized protein [Ptychodera flava]|uniref:uncharacterized protein isoform X2 n=1 Tax=Ptychodera flava TaxID=63121 RepID=UPI003969EF8D
MVTLMMSAINAIVLDTGPETVMIHAIWVMEEDQHHGLFPGLIADHLEEGLHTEVEVGVVIEIGITAESPVVITAEVVAEAVIAGIVTAMTNTTAATVVITEGAATTTGGKVIAIVIAVVGVKAVSGISETIVPALREVVAAKAAVVVVQVEVEVGRKREQFPRK